MLDTHIGGQHMNAKRETWGGKAGSQRRKGGQFFCYLGAEHGAKLRELAEREKVPPGEIVRRATLEYLGQHSV